MGILFVNVTMIKNSITTLTRDMLILVSLDTSDKKRKNFFQNLSENSKKRKFGEDDLEDSLQQKV